MAGYGFSRSAAGGGYGGGNVPYGQQPAGLGSLLQATGGTFAGMGRRRRYGSPMGGFGQPSPQMPESGSSLSGSMGSASMSNPTQIDVGTLANAMGAGGSGNGNNVYEQPKEGYGTKAISFPADRAMGGLDPTQGTFNTGSMNPVGAIGNMGSMGSGVDTGTRAMSPVGQNGLAGSGMGDNPLGWLNGNQALSQNLAGVPASTQEPNPNSLAQAIGGISPFGGNSAVGGTNGIGRQIDTSMLPGAGSNLLDVLTQLYGGGSMGQGTMGIPSGSNLPGLSDLMGFGSNGFSRRLSPMQSNGFSRGY